MLRRVKIFKLTINATANTSIIKMSRSTANTAAIVAGSFPARLDFNVMF